MNILQLVQMTKPVLAVVASVPWERFYKAEPAPSLLETLPPEILEKQLSPAPSVPVPQESTVEQSSALVSSIPSPMEKPGCAAAEEAIQVLGHLQGLADGDGGFGVLALDIERLERAAQGAEGMKDQETADEFRAWKERLPEIRDQETAELAVEEFTPIKRVAWQLGRRCGAASSERVHSRAKDLAVQVKAGEITKAEAVAELRKEV